MLYMSQVRSIRAVKHAAAGSFGRVSASRALRCSSQIAQEAILSP